MLQLISETNVSRESSFWFFFFQEKEQGPRALVPQGLDGVQAGGLVGGVVAEEDADGHGEAHGQGDIAGPGEAGLAEEGAAHIIIMTIIMMDMMT